MEAWLGLIGAIVGVIAAWGLNEATKLIAKRRKATHDLNAAAFVCLDRLLKIQSAVTRFDQEQQDREIWLLGRDLDSYRDCMAQSPKWRTRHWAAYRRMAPVLLEHDLTNLDQTIAELEAICGATDLGTSE